MSPGMRICAGVMVVVLGACSSGGGNSTPNPTTPDPVAAVLGPDGAPTPQVTGTWQSVVRAHSLVEERIAAGSCDVAVAGDLVALELAAGRIRADVRQALDVAGDDLRSLADTATSARNVAAALARVETHCVISDVGAAEVSLAAVRAADIDALVAVVGR